MAAEQAKRQRSFPHALGESQILCLFVTKLKSGERQKVRGRQSHGRLSGPPFWSEHRKGEVLGVTFGPVSALGVGG